MFTLQAQDLIRQLRGQIPDPAVNALEGMLGNCSAQLEHRGPVSFTIDGNYMPNLFGYPRGGPLGRNCDGTAKAALTVVNEAGRFVGDPCLTDCVDNGLALRVIGPSWMDATRIDTLYVNSLKDLCGRPIEGVSTGGGSELMRFKVTNESLGAGMCLAEEVEWTGAAYAVTGTEFVVLDFTPTSEFSTRWKNNYYGWCTRQNDRLTVTVGIDDIDAYECIWVESKARFIEFELTADMTAGSAAADVLYAWGADDRADVPATVTIIDRSGRLTDAEIGYIGIAVWDEQEEEYVPLTCFGIEGAVIPDSSLFYCIRITVGEQNASCLYEGESIEATLGVSPNFCTQDIWGAGTSCWVFAPNYENDTDLLKEGTYHFGIKLHAAFDVGGDIRPLFMIKADMDQFELLKIEDTSRRDDCTYNATVVSLGGDYCSEDNSSDDDEVYVYLPNSDDDSTHITGPKYAWGKRILNDYNGKPLYLSKVEVRNARALYAIIELDQLDCDDIEGTGRYVEFIEQGDHLEPWGEIDAEVEFDNRFSFCSEAGLVGLLMLNERAGAKPLLVQVKHTCIDIVVGIVPDPESDCNLLVSKVTASVIICSTETTVPVNMMDLICDCCE